MHDVLVLYSGIPEKGIYIHVVKYNIFFSYHIKGLQEMFGKTLTLIMLIFIIMCSLLDSSMPKWKLDCITEVLV